MRPPLRSLPDPGRTFTPEARRYGGLVPVVVGQPGVAGAVVAGALAPRQVAGAVAVHRQAEVVAVGKPGARAGLVWRTGAAVGDPDGGAPGNSPVPCRPVPDVPRRRAVAVVFPGDGEITGPGAGRDLREAGPDLAAAGREHGWGAPGHAVVRGGGVQPHRRPGRGVCHVGGKDGPRVADRQRNLRAVEVVRAVLARAGRLLLAPRHVSGVPWPAA